MHAVIFEVMPKSDRVEEYFEIAESIRGDLEKIDGFISVERFNSMANEGKILSLSFWETESAIEEWRNQTAHKNAQSKGYNEVFSSYRLRVTQVVRDYTMVDREEAPQTTPGRRRRSCSRCQTRS